MLRVGESAPEFSLPDQNGRPISLSSLRGRPVILYFFPKANTPGCTRETEGFVGHHPEFSTRQVAVIGVSVDPPDRQKAFADRCQVPFPLLSDSERSVARAYGVLGVLGMAKRVTFLIDPEGRVVEVVSGMLPGPHVRAAVDRFGGPPP